MAHQKLLFQLQKKFEVFAADEEKYLMEKVAGLLAESNARKKNMVRDDICSLDETAFERSNNLQAETSKLHDFTSSMREQWESCMERSEEAFRQNVSSIEQKRCFLAENLQQCKTRADSCSEQWIAAQNSVLALGRSNAEAMASVISDGNKANNQLHTRFSSAATAGFEDNDVSCKSLLCSMEDSLKLDHGNCENVKSMIIASRAELQHLQHGHHEKTTEISGNADRSLGDYYKVDEATCSTPRRREINIPSRQSMGDLVTRVEDVVKSFWDSTTPTKLVGNGNGKQHRAASTLETQSQRAPLATIN
ncbi:kinesin-like protein KIN-5A [Phragmites australis]|uniref:kinesin-like protein KIN-5A n=1 Tax=Phragmites australis TaxID=29695 RepID=UPI002D789DA1|nr:kinesin-like protein KIN-5A [Phragmites australis]XP_062182978.1 kinesin-like protein KIN-5A [Phragmites australis]